MQPQRLSLDMLRDISLFKDLDDATLETLQEHLPKRQVEPGAAVVNEGDTAQEMFIIVAGELEVLKHTPRPKSDIRVAMLGPGDWFGEMSLIDPHPRSATVRAIAPTLMLSLSKEHLQSLFYERDIRAYATIVTSIARELCRKLRVTDGLVSQMMNTISHSFAPPQNMP